MHAQSHVHISFVSRDNFRIRKYIKQQNRFLTSLVLFLIINKILYSENTSFVTKMRMALSILQKLH